MVCWLKICEAVVRALIAGIAALVNLDDSRVRVALACINECKRGIILLTKKGHSVLAHILNFRWFVV